MRISDSGSRHVASEVGQTLRRLDARANQGRREGVRARAALRASRRPRRQACPPRARLAARGERVPLRKTSRPAPSNVSPRSPTATSSSLATPTPWIHEHSGLPFVNCGSVGKPDRGDGPALFALLEPTDDGVSASIHREARRGRLTITHLSPKPVPGHKGLSLPIAECRNAPFQAVSLILATRRARRPPPCKRGGRRRRAGVIPRFGCRSRRFRGDPAGSGAQAEGDVRGRGALVGVSVSRGWPRFGEAAGGRV
jgi:hypothetical protein